MNGHRSILNYSTRRCCAWVSRRRVVFSLLALCALIAAGAYFGRAYLYQAKYVLAQRRALAHRLPADLVVYDTEPLAAKRLLAQSHYRPAQAIKFGREGRPGNWQSPAFYHPSFLDALVSHKSDGVVFLHGRANTSNEARLVLVGISQPRQSADSEVHVELRAHVFSLAEWKPKSTLRKHPRSSLFDLPWDLQPKDQLRFYAGQADSGDPTHFTVEYSLKGERGIIDGYVRPALSAEQAQVGGQPFDQVVFLVRDGPLWGRMDSTPTKGREAPPP